MPQFPQGPSVLGQLCDIAEVVRHYEALDWAAVVRRGTEYGVAGPVACSLRLAAVLLDAPLPAWVVSMLAPSLDDRDVMLFARQRVITTRQWVATDLASEEGTYGGVSLFRTVLRRIVPTREYMRFHYGTAGLGAYWRRLGHAARVLARSVRRPGELTEDLSVDKWLHALAEGSSVRSKTTAGEAPVVAGVPGRNE